MSSNTKRIAKNTLLLYCRQLICMGISLYTVRVVLGVLGAEDYGIFNVVGGTVAMLSFLTGAMASATQRFFSYALGKKDAELLSKVFGTNIVVYCAFAVIAVLLFETIGLWFVYSRLNVPPNKLSTVKILYQLITFSFLASMFSSPFIAIVMAHEEMNIYAGFSIIEACLKFIAVLLLFIVPANKLLSYGALLLCSSVLIASLYVIVCTRRYKECSFRTCRFEWNCFKQIMDYTGWTLFGSVSTVIRAQAITILVNQFFNPVTVAARSIALSISSAMNAFTSSFSTGLYPPIIKAWAVEDRERMYHLVYFGCKIAFFLNWICTFPCLLEIDFLLKLWLKNPPREASLFSVLALIETVLLAISGPLMTAARAAGDMKKYELPLGTIQILIFPVSWLILYMGGAAWTTLAVAIGANFVMLFVRLIIVSQMTSLSIPQFLTRTVLPIIKTVLISSVLLLTIRYFLPSSILCSICVFASSIPIIMACIFFFGLRIEEKEKLFSIIKQTKNEMMRRLLK